MSVRDRQGELLGALHDGELRGLAARRARRLAERSGEARRELARIHAVGGHVRRALADAPELHGADVPDLWPAIAAGLASADAERESAAPRAGRWLLRPLWASTAVAAAAAALILGLLLPREGPGDVVQWLDAEGSPVMVLERPGDTVIWVLSPGADEEPGATSERSRDGWGGRFVAT